jgi:carboxyl-terminal processing protease
VWKNATTAIAALSLLAIVATATTAQTGCDSPWFSESPTDPELELVEQAWQIILEDYVESDEIDLEALSRGAIEGMIEALDDPYSAYVGAEEYEAKKDVFEGSFGGIGAEMTIDDEGRIKVVAPIAGSPAYRAGIKPGDVVTHIDGESTEDMSFAEAVLNIRGEPGTEVTLGILRDSEAQDVTITREVIDLSTVTAKMLSDKIVHVTLTAFSSPTEDDMKAVLEQAIAGGATGAVLDLRGNPGGLLESAVAVASQFLDGGIVTEVEYGDGERETWEVEEGGIATDLPLVVLVDGGSASGSEVVAGALQDRGRAPIIGTQTFGKGSVNHFHRLADGSAIYITGARWYTPNGNLIEGQGITPDEVVEITAEDIEQGRDPQLERAIEYLNEEW